jgi:hypothetical protein
MNWRELKEITVLGRKYKIIPVPKTKLRKFDDKQEVGRLCPGKREILIYNNITSDEDYQETVLHEITHELLEVMATKVENKEDFVETWTMYWYDTLKRNGLLSC